MPLLIMNANQIFDEIMKNVMNVPQTEGHTKMIEGQFKAVKDSTELLKAELSKIYNKGYAEGIEFQKKLQIQKQQKEN